MRLLDTRTLRLTTFNEELCPRYAILSHRWEEGEVSLQQLEADMINEKIRSFCAKAAQRGFSWCWVDTCCIDKTNDAELSEAINSMYQWYEKSAECFVYLSDIHAQETRGIISRLYPELARSRWFTRGWTLQELIAPRHVYFYEAKWKYIGSRHDMASQLASITEVDPGVLHGSTTLRECSVANIMSWAVHRETTRKEDIAYCMLGLFDIHMPLIYGEGAKAFLRLQEEISKQYSDQSIFAWNPPLSRSSTSSGDQCGIFAPSPACFSRSYSRPFFGVWDTEFTVTNRGVRLRMPLKYDAPSNSYLGVLSCVSSREEVALEFHAESDSFEDHDNMIRRPVPLRLGQWSADPQFKLTTVYLATDAALGHIRAFGQEYHNNIDGRQIDVILDDAGGFIKPDRLGPLLHFGASLSDTSPNHEHEEYPKRLEVSKLFRTATWTVSTEVETTLSQDFYIRLGLRILPNALLDREHLCGELVVQPKHGTRTFPPEPDETERSQFPSGDSPTGQPEIVIDGVKIRFDFIERRWWAETCLDVVISTKKMTE